LSHTRFIGLVARFVFDSSTASTQKNNELKEQLRKLVHSANMAESSSRRHSTVLIDTAFDTYMASITRNGQVKANKSPEKYCLIIACTSPQV
jgi:hypothetical protein